MNAAAGIFFEGNKEGGIVDFSDGFLLHLH